jgi:hypothetical protein
MNNRWLLYLVGASLVGLLVLVFLYPQAMISPGEPLRAHQQTASDCFACHTPLLGSQPEKCIACHQLDRIGRFTTAGQPIAPRAGQTPFHQELIEQNCMACHREHRGIGTGRTSRAFSHELLQPAVRNRCTSCHAAPDDVLHRQISGNCQQCHSAKAWQPATFDHDRYFRLDRDHNASCTTCHSGKDFTRFTCYGCHEHSAAGIRREHREEGIKNFDNCVECHRSAEEPDEGDERDDD